MIDYTIVPWLADTQSVPTVKIKRVCSKRYRYFLLVCLVFVLLTISCLIGYQSGYNQALIGGYWQGHADGYHSGYGNGYQDGMNATMKMCSEREVRC